MFVVELLIIQPHSYTQVHIPHGVHVNHVDVAIAEIVGRVEVQRQIEEIKSVRNVVVHDLQQHFLLETRDDSIMIKKPVWNIADHQSSTLVGIQLRQVNVQ